MYCFGLVKKLQVDGKKSYKDGFHFNFCYPFWSVNFIIILQFSKFTIKGTKVSSFLHFPIVRDTKEKRSTSNSEISVPLTTLLFHCSNWFIYVYIKPTFHLINTRCRYYRCDIYMSILNFFVSKSSLDISRVWNGFVDHWVVSDTGNGCLGKTPSLYLYVYMYSRL